MAPEPEIALNIQKESPCAQLDVHPGDDTNGCPEQEDEPGNNEKTRSPSDWLFLSLEAWRNEAHDAARRVREEDYRHRDLPSASRNGDRDTGAK